MTIRVELDRPGFYLEPIVSKDGGPVIGYIEYHTRPASGESCSGFIWIDSIAAEGKPVWRLESPAPAITLRPSIACRSCTRHGFITDGKWVDA